MVVQRLRAERLARGWTQKDLAARSGIERANIARLEAGRHSPRVDTLESLAKAMSLSLAKLFEAGQAAAELTELSLRLAKTGAVRLKKELRRMRELGIIDEAGRRKSRELPAEMIEGTSEAV
jgi:transcriptional regulator with XRE-family HTH domain